MEYPIVSIKTSLQVERISHYCYGVHMDDTLSYNIWSIIVHDS